jgi:putative solute:sodium symporter small subunit
LLPQAKQTKAGFQVYYQKEKSMATSAKTSAALEPAHVRKQRDMASYWAANVRLIVALLLIWFAVIFLPILFVEQLNQIEILTGFPLGYYMGAQGALIVFVILIFIYAWCMERIDQAYGVDQE